ncbi:MAG: outer membrane beta-barrel family protein [Marinilabiliales bacterium]
MKNYIIFLIIYLFPAIFFAQEHPFRGGNGGMDKPKIGTIYGYIKDADNNLPVEYASIVVYSVKDSSIITGTLADKKGYFLIENLPFGPCYVEVDFLGFIKKRINKIRITPDSKDINLGVIKLTKSIQNLDEVEVVGERKTIEYKIDKKVITVGKDIINEGGNAVDVLQNTPSVETDIDGNVSLRGSSSFTVLIDGKPTVLEGSEALQQIPASSIQSIEIITNPSAKYDPDGSAGIINVILKKQLEKGLNGIINASAGTFGNYGFDGTFNYRIGKINFVTGLNIRNRNHPGSGIMNRQSTFNDTTYYIDKEMDRSRRHGGNSINAGIEYDISKNDFISFTGEYGNFLFGHNNDGNTHEYDNFHSYDTYYVSNNDFEVSHNFYNLSSYYQHKFKQKDHQINSTITFSNHTGDDSETLDQYYSDNEWNNIDNYPLNQESLENDKSKRLDAQIDYVKPIGKNKLEAGIKSRLYNGTSDYHLDVFDYDLNSMQTIDSLTNSIEFDRSIYSAYSTYSGRFLNFEFLLGMRLEYTDRLIKQNIMNLEYPINRLDYFPTLHLSRQITENHQVQASYSRRINRPREWYLDPFPNYSDPLNIRMGNPELEPEYTDSYELNYQYKFKRSSFISIEAYYKQSSNLIERVRYVDTNNVMIMTLDNLSKDYSIGTEVMANIDIFKWWNINISFNLYNYNIDGEILETSVNKSINTWGTRANTTFRLRKGTMVQINTYYTAPSITAQGDRDAFVRASLAIKQEFLKRKLTVSLQGRDILGPIKYSFTTYGSNYTVYNEFINKAPSINVSVSYKINNYRQKRRNMNMEEIDYDAGGDM